MARRWRPGDAVVLRELWRGRVWAAWPATVVEDAHDQRIFHIPAGAVAKWPADPEGKFLHVPDGDWRLVDVVTSRPILSFAWPGEPHAVMLLRDDAGAAAAFYVNLQSPLRPTPIGFDFVDHLLDAIVAPDGSSWRWKDEDDLRAAVARGEVSAERAEALRAEGERVVRRVVASRPPFDRPWARWRADPAWGAPVLPPGWDAVGDDGGEEPRSGPGRPGLGLQ